MTKRGQVSGGLMLLLSILTIFATLVPGAALPTALAEEPELRALVVLDVSGSMKRDGGNGQSLLAGARRALSELVYSLPAESSLGLRVYGSEAGGTDRAVTCRDSLLLAPVAPVAPEKLIAATRGLTPTGDTPIGYSLSQAANDFPSGATARDVIVLISDGEENCSTTPPCDVVRKLRSTGFEVRIQTVGVALQGDAAARDQLKCIARVSGGDYFDAQNTDALSAALNRISEQARGQLGAGQQVRPGPEQVRAKRVEPGSYRLTMRPGQVSWFRFKAPVGSQPRVLATIQGKPGRSVPSEFRDCPSWRVELRNLGGEGFIYSPYGNSGVFDGVDYGSTGASTTGPLEENSTGIDYPGRWTIALALGLDGRGEVLDCAEQLPAVDFPVRFTLSLDGSEEIDPEQSDPAGGDSELSAEESADPKVDPEKAEINSDPTEPSAADQFNNPVTPEDPNAGRGPILVACAAVSLIGLAGLSYRIRRRRRRGW